MIAAIISDSLYFIGATAAFVFGWYLAIWFGARHHREYRKAAMEREAHLKSTVIHLLDEVERLAERRGIRRA